MDLLHYKSVYEMHILIDVLCNANVNTQDVDGCTPLMNAIIRRSIKHALYFIH